MLISDAALASPAHLLTRQVLTVNDGEVGNTCSIKKKKKNGVISKNNKTSHAEAREMPPTSLREIDGKNKEPLPSGTRINSSGSPLSENSQKVDQGRGGGSTPVDR